MKAILSQLRHEIWRDELHQSLMSKPSMHNAKLLIS
jgi:hypothetical protein